MAMDQKARSLHCRMLAGLRFENIGEEVVICLRDVPYELEDIVARWAMNLPVELITKDSPNCILRQHPTRGIALTETGWSTYVSWMVDTLIKEQRVKTKSVKIGIDQKARSLHYRFPAGLKFEYLGERSVINLRDVPYELEVIIVHWIKNLPSELTTRGLSTCILRKRRTKGIALTESGWSKYVSWMVDTLIKAQCKRIKLDSNSD